MIKNETVNALRFLSADSVERAQSACIQACLLAWQILQKFFGEITLTIHPQILIGLIEIDLFYQMAMGQCCYSLLHLTGYKLSLDDLKDFRQLHSKTPGHPEYGITDGVETTTGPLGQGLANAIGMAIAEKFLAQKLILKK